MNPMNEQRLPGGGQSAQHSDGALHDLAALACDASVSPTGGGGGGGGGGGVRLGSRTPSDRVPFLGQSVSYHNGDGRSLGPGSAVPGSGAGALPSFQRGGLGGRMQHSHHEVDHAAAAILAKSLASSSHYTDYSHGHGGGGGHTMPQSYSSGGSTVAPMSAFAHEFPAHPPGTSAGQMLYAPAYRQPPAGAALPNLGLLASLSPSATAGYPPTPPILHRGVAGGGMDGQPWRLRADHPPQATAPPTAAALAATAAARLKRSVAGKVGASRSAAATNAEKGRRQRAPVRSLTVRVPDLCRGEGELGWHPQLLAMTTIELNDYVNKSDMRREEINALKALRRRIKNRAYTRQARERKRGGTPEEGEEGYGEDGVYADEGENGAKLRRTDYASSPPPFDPPQHRMLPQLVVQGQGSPAQIPELIQHPPAPSAPPSLHPALPPRPDRNGGRAQPT